MINKANEEHTTVKEIGDKYIAEYYKDADGLNIKRATDVYKRQGIDNYMYV